MVQESDPAPRYRDRHRAARRREFLDIARRIINSEGQAALTMQRLADEVGSSAGGIYIYFASKDALVSDLQLEAFEILLESYRQGQARLEEELATLGVDPGQAALTRVIGNCWFWIDAEHTLPSEHELSRRLIGGPGAGEADPTSGSMHVAFQLLEEGRRRLDAATDAKVLEPGNNTERSLMLIASSTGMLQVSRLANWDRELFDGAHLAISLTHDILVGWGASRAELAKAEEHLGAFRAEHQIAPKVDAPGP